ncbi:MAG: hypothetical protein SXA11_06795 [Cyanobacteriota bacterium]|nr:hypothetical protein [Cyanobacteriota bacterium]
MKLSKITDSEKYLSFPFSLVNYLPIAGLSFPPGMLAITAALEYVWEDRIPFTKDIKVNIKGFKQDIGEVWEIDIEVEDFKVGIDFTYSIRVVRDRNDYNAQLIELTDNF